MVEYFYIMIGLALCAAIFFAYKAGIKQGIKSGVDQTYSGFKKVLMNQRTQATLQMDKLIDLYQEKYQIRPDFKEFTKNQIKEHEKTLKLMKEQMAETLKKEFDHDLDKMLKIRDSVNH